MQEPTTQPNIVVPVILCGGSGTRLWPASREARPKQFLALTDELSLLQNTMRRALRISGAPASSLVVVTLAAMVDSVTRQLAEINESATGHILCEPAARNTAAAVALAANYVHGVFGPDAVMWVLPADHHIAREDVLARAYAHALSAARDQHLVTFGITPSRPDTGYGYIQLGDAHSENAHRAARFVEKPDRATAESYLGEGNYLWNSGMFLFSAASVLAHYAEHAPAIHNAAAEAMAKGTPARPCPEAYGAVEKLSFDKAIMEKSGRVAVVPCNPEWSDVGSWESLWDIRAKDRNENVIDGRAACHNAKGCFIQAKSDRLIAVAGVDNIVVVETDDALLITNKSDSESLRGLVGALKDSGAREVFDTAAQAPQPWGMVKPRAADKALSAREITLTPGQQKIFAAQNAGLCLYTVLEGEATITAGGTIRTVGAFASADVTAGTDYTIANRTGQTLRMVEVQKAAQEGIFFGAQPAANTSKKVA